MSISSILENGKSGNKQSNAINTGGRKSKIDEERLKKLVDQGKKDAEIALILGVARRTVGMARKRLGLNENHSLDKDRLIALQKEGKNDTEIAKELGVTRRAVGMARTQLGLAPNRKQGRPPKVEITKDMAKDILSMLDRGYTPREVASRYGITRNNVIKVYMNYQPRTWTKLYEQLNASQKLIFNEWQNKAKLIISKKMKLFEVENLKFRIKIIKGYLELFPPEKKGDLPSPEVMSRMGVRNAYLVDISQDVEYVSLQHKIRLLQNEIDKRYWQEVRRGTENMDTQTMEVAERYLEEEVYIPFFASEFSGMILGLIKDTQKYKDIAGINLDTAATEEDYDEIYEEIEASQLTTTGTARRRGRGGGRRKSIEEQRFWSN